MKKKNSRKSEVMAGRAKCESLQFQAEWGAKRLGVNIGDVERQRIAEEIMVLGNMDLVDAVLALKDTIEGIKGQFSLNPEGVSGALDGSMVAFCVGIMDKNPMDSDEVINPNVLNAPCTMKLKFDNDVRNQVVDWVREKNYGEVKTMLGKPVLKLKNMIVEFGRVIRE
ncbi:MAG: hypothetical protein SO188_11310 [Prevotella sp.]|nr:hypothetical protein [Prevotella sp.]